MSFSAPVGEPVLSSGGSSADEGLTGGLLSFCLQRINKEITRVSCGNLYTLIIKLQLIKSNVIKICLPTAQSNASSYRDYKSVRPC